MLDTSLSSVWVLFEFMSVVFILFLFGALYLFWMVTSDVFRLGFCLVITLIWFLFVIGRGILIMGCNLECLIFGGEFLVKFEDKLRDELMRGN